MKTVHVVRCVFCRALVSNNKINENGARGFAHAMKYNNAEIERGSTSKTTTAAAIVPLKSYKPLVNVIISAAIKVNNNKVAFRSLGKPVRLLRLTMGQ